MILVNLLGLYYSQYQQTYEDTDYTDDKESHSYVIFLYLHSPSL